MKRGDIYWGQLAPRSGSEQSGIRPVLIISSDAFNLVHGWQSVNIIPLSTSTQDQFRNPSTVFFPTGTAGLDCGSWLLCFQVTTLDRSKLGQYVGSLSLEGMKLVDRALKNALQLD
jgi:mRNA interferase MazF